MSRPSTRPAIVDERLSGADVGGPGTVEAMWPASRRAGGVADVKVEGQKRIRNNRFTRSVGHRNCTRCLLAAFSSFLLVVIPACSGDDTASSGTNQQTAEPQSPTSPAPPEDAAPSDLQGRWGTELGGSSESETVTLTILEASYQITRGPNQGTGKISVSGDEIEFFGSSLCEGTGTYQWSVQGDTLELAPVRDDPCSGRSVVIVGYTYTRR